MKSRIKNTMYVTKPKNANDEIWNQFTEFLQDFQGRTVETTDALLTIEASGQVIKVKSS